jgi:hypothetical protein
VLEAAAPAGHGRMWGAPTTRNAISAVVVNRDAVLNDFGWSVGGISLLSRRRCGYVNECDCVVGGRVKMET